MRRDRERVAQVWRLRSDARRARLLAAQTTAEDRRLLQRMADRWDRQADTVEGAVNDDRSLR